MNLFGLLARPFTLIAICLAILTYYDSKLKGRPSFAWALFVFITGGLGYILYIIKSPDMEKLAASRNRSTKAEEEIVRNITLGTGEAMESGLSPFEHLTHDFRFHDDELDRLISERKFPEAERYLEGILKIAKETNDQNTLDRYERYVEDIKYREL